MRISVSQISRETVIPNGPGLCLAILVITLCTAGCILVEPEETVTPINAETIPTEMTTVPAVMATRVPVASTSLPVKNITITRPVNLKPYTRINLPVDVVTSVQSVTNPHTMDTITSYLRWESVRARTGIADAARIERTIKDLDSALISSRLDEELVLYSGVEGDVPLLIVNESRYTADGYVSCSFDPSVIYHEMDTAGRDREGFVSLLVIPQKRGSYLLYLNETTRTILLPRSMIWELDSEEKIERIEFTVESVPWYRDDEMKNVRLLHMTQIS